jgi:hypothetical protein
MSYTNGTQTQSQSMNGLLEINTDNISASSIITNDLTATTGSVDTLTVLNTITGTITNATNAVNATNATNATNISTTQDNTNSGYLSWIKYTGSSFQNTFFSSNLFYNANENKIYADLNGIANSAINASFATTATNATNALKIAVDTTTTNASHYLTFVNNITGNLIPYVSSNLSFNPITQMLTSTYATISQLTASNYIFINGTENATSVITGALRVLNGGMSVAQDIFLGGSINTTADDTVGGTLTVNGTGSNFANDLTVGDFLNVDTLTTTNGINAGSLSVSNNASVGADITVGGGITSPYMIANNASNFTLSYATINYNTCANVNVYR